MWGKRYFVGIKWFLHLAVNLSSLSVSEWVTNDGVVVPHTDSDHLVCQMCWVHRIGSMPCVLFFLVMSNHLCCQRYIHWRRNISIHCPHNSLWRSKPFRAVSHRAEGKWGRGVGDELAASLLSLSLPQSSLLPHLPCSSCHYFYYYHYHTAAPTFDTIIIIIFF